MNEKAVAIIEKKSTVVLLSPLSKDSTRIADQEFRFGAGAILEGSLGQVIDQLCRNDAEEGDREGHQIGMPSIVNAINDQEVR